MNGGDRGCLVRYVLIPTLTNDPQTRVSYRSLRQSSRLRRPLRFRDFRSFEPGVGGPSPVHRLGYGTRTQTPVENVTTDTKPRSESEEHEVKGVDILSLSSRATCLIYVIVSHTPTQSQSNPPMKKEDDDGD